MTNPALIALQDNLAQADALKYGDYGQMLSLANLAAGQAQALGELQSYARALTLQAWAYANMAKYEESLSYALEALIMTREYGFMELEARAVNIIAISFFQCELPYEATRLYEYQLQLSDKLGSDELKAIALHDFAMLKRQQGDYTTATHMLLEALRIIPPGLHEELDRSVIYANIANSYSDREDFEQALVYAQEALRLAYSASSMEMQAYCHSILALIYEKCGEMQHAYEQVTAARACIESEAATTMTLEVSVNIEMVISRLLTREGHYAEAIAAWEQAYTLAHQGVLIEFASLILHELKGAYQQANDMAGMSSVFERLAKDVPALKNQQNSLRFTVLRTVFSTEEDQVRGETQLSQQKHAILERLSHEFRTPLAIIQASSEIIERHHERLTLDQRQQRLQRINQQVGKMTHMLEDIVSVLSADDDGEFQISAFPLAALAQEALLRIEDFQPTRGRIQVEVAQGAGVIQGYFNVLVNVTTHLLSNALKFSSAEVILRLAHKGEMLLIAVIDQGIGIRPQEQQAVFQPLVRGTNFKEISGVGLGLAVVAKLVDQMYGKIELSSTEGVGTTVTVRIPVEV